jgi:type I restriction enzyme R subunit
LKNDDDDLSLVIVRDMWLSGFDVPFLHTMYIVKPMQTHSLIQAISRVNRVHESKPGGLIVDYISISHELKNAIKQYTKDDTEKSIVPIDEAVDVFKRKYREIQDLLIGFDYTNFSTGKSTEKLEILAGAMSTIVDQEEGKSKFKKSVNNLMRTAKLCGAHDEILSVRDDLVFFDTLQKNFSKNTGVEVIFSEEVDFAVGGLVQKSMQSLGVKDLLKSSGITNTLDISILSDEFLQDVKITKRKNLAIELLMKMVSNEIKQRRGKNIVHADSLLEKLQKTLQNYEKRPLNSVNIITALISISKDIKDAKKRGEKLKLKENELAFYDALEIKDTSVKVLGDEVLVSIARELVEVIRNNTTIDWPLRETGKAKIMASVKRVLNKHGYPISKKDSTTELIMEQATQMFA